MDGVLLIDKPAGPTSHDVVQRVRRAVGQRDIGHTGTLDPRATGLLPLVLGRATRLASVLTGSDKTYEAAVRLGFATETDDAEGPPTTEARAVDAGDVQIALALDGFRGAFEQTPPNHSAKKIDGTRAYELARRAQPMFLKPVTVTAHALDVVGRDGDILYLSMTVSSGFYVRALARDLGARLGCGAHLATLRRTRIGTLVVGDAVPLEEVERLGKDVEARLLTPAAALPHLPGVSVNEHGLKRVLHGNMLAPEHLLEQGVLPGTGAGPVKILGPDGRLIALAHLRGGALHPAVVLG